MTICNCFYLEGDIWNFPLVYKKNPDGGEKIIDVRKFQELRLQKLVKEAAYSLTHGFSFY